MRILITEFCNAQCRSCFNKDIRQAIHMDTQKLISLINHLAKHISIIKIMGGEPTTHPDFLKLYDYTQKKFKKVVLFTNALNDIILDIKPRRFDAITYNSRFIDAQFNYHKFLPDFSFKRWIETMISVDSDIPKVIGKIKIIYKECRALLIHDAVAFSITFNCREDIFKHRINLNKKWVKLLKAMYDFNPAIIAFDHTVPLCFWTKRSRDFINKTRGFTDYFSLTCRPQCNGLIDASFNLLHCNQYPVKISNVFDRDNRLLDYSQIHARLNNAYLLKNFINLKNNNCGKCNYFNHKCTGGCFRHKIIN